MGNMPGDLKRFSVGFYARCMMFDAAEERGLQPDNPVVYDPVSGPTALWVLLLSTVFLLAVGMFLFRRTEFDLDAAAESIRASGWPVAEEFARKNVLTIPTRDQATAVFGG